MKRMFLEAKFPITLNIKFFHRSLILDVSPKLRERQTRVTMKENPQNTTSVSQYIGTKFIQTIIAPRVILPFFYHKYFNMRKQCSANNYVHLEQ